jgi:hypothetical protein
LVARSDITATILALGGAKLAIRWQCAHAVRVGVESEAIRKAASDCILAGKPKLFRRSLFTSLDLSPTESPAADELGDMGSQWPWVGRNQTVSGRFSW